MSGVLAGGWGATLNSVVGADPLEKVGFEQTCEGEKGLSATVNL